MFADLNHEFVEIKTREGGLLRDLWSFTEVDSSPPKPQPSLLMKTLVGRVNFEVKV